MPCDSVITTSVELKINAENKDFLLAALKSLGYAVQSGTNIIRFTTREGMTGTILSDGKLTVTSNSRYRTADTFDVNPIKRAYSRAVVEATAQQYGWTITQTADFEFSVEKETFESTFESSF